MVEACKDGIAWMSARTVSTLRGRVKPFFVGHSKKVGPGIQCEMLDGNYAISTSMADISALDMRELCNRQADACENRIKKCGSDLAGKRISLSKLGPNRVLAHMKEIALNLFMCIRRLLFRGWARAQAVPPQGAAGSVQPRQERPRPEDAASHPQRGQMPPAGQVEPQALRRIRSLRRPLPPPEGGPNDSAACPPLPMKCWFQTGIRGIVCFFGRERDSGPKKRGQQAK